MNFDETSPPDGLLVDRARGGDEAAFTELFRRYYEPILGYFYRTLLEFDRAQDAAQECFIRAAQRLHSLRDGQAFQSWIYRIASHVSVDFCRRANAEQRKLDCVAADAAIQQNAAFEDRHDTEQRVRGALEKLPIKERQAVVLVLMDGLTHAEAAQRLGCAETTVSWRIFIAKRTLKKLLAQ